MSPQIALIGGVVVCYFVATVADGVADRAAADLTTEARERIFQRQVKVSFWVRALSILGALLILVGMLKVFVVIKVGAPLQWGYPCAALGFVVLCVERIVRVWYTNAAFAREPEAASARLKLLLVTLLVTILELGLASFVMWWILDRSPFLKQLQEQKALQGASPASRDPATTPKPKSENVWVNETGALKLLGQDKAYLDLLVPYQQIRTKADGGVTLYLQDHLFAAKESGLPSWEELKASKLIAKTPNEIAQHIEPLLKQGKRIEAIKCVRELTGWGLQESKEFVESLPGGTATPPPQETLPETKPEPVGEALLE